MFIRFLYFFPFKLLKRNNKVPGRKFRSKIKRSFTVLEYALLITVLVGALTAMAFYLKRSVAGRWRHIIDSEIGHGRQYDPYATVEW